MFEFKTNALGNLKILALIDNVALLEKQYDTQEKYIVAHGFDMNEKRWNKGCYYVSLEDAFNGFKRAIEL